ncbi:MAG: DUF4956 domain-containing protein [Bacteroidales bacterium]|nr:DUF4956 domain-containing protein [Bacteroidales bacterium]
MNKWELFQKFLVTQEEQIQLPDFLINALLVLLLTWALELTYRKCGKSLSNRKSFAAMFILLGFTTMLIISVVKSSLALSLGLVGALSIVRFRAAIKEPEELAYLFLVISIGLGLGANLRLVTIVAFGIIMLVIWGRFLIGTKSDVNNLFLSISASNKDLSLTKTEEIIAKYFKKYQIKRFDEDKDTFETAFLIESQDIASIEKCKSEIKAISEDIRISFIDNKIV